jgi:hypothetical protein
LSEVGIGGKGTGLGDQIQAGWSGPNPRLMLSRRFAGVP